jgi:hypothetical protein
MVKMNRVSDIPTGLKLIAKTIQSEWEGAFKYIWVDSNGWTSYSNNPSPSHNCYTEHELERARELLYEAKWELELPNFNEAKFDKGKVRMELLISGVPRALLEVGKVLTYGAEKYAAHSWKNVPEAESRYHSAQIRHQIATGTGEIHDQESGLLHLAHEACNVLFRLELELKKKELAAQATPPLGNAPGEFD